MSVYIVEDWQRSRCPRGARNATPPISRTGSQSRDSKAALGARQQTLIADLKSRRFLKPAWGPRFFCRGMG